MDLLRSSNEEVYQVDCSKFLTLTGIRTSSLTRLSTQIDLSLGSSRSNTSTDVVRVAVLSTIFQNWSKLFIL